MPSTKTVAIIGAGPRGIGVLERLGANADLLAGRRLKIHLIDPYPPGPGRVWRHAQSPLLWMNWMAEDVTMFTDASFTGDGPIRPDRRWPAGRARSRRARSMRPGWIATCLPRCTGIVHFLGADTRVAAVDGHFVGSNSSSPHVVRATALVEARIPGPAIQRTGNDLLRSLYESGDGAPEVLLEPPHETGRLLVTPGDLRVVNNAGHAHRRRFALGAPTSLVSVAAFSRPNVNSPAFRQNDIVARAILTTP